MALSAGRPSQKLPPKTLASLRGEGEKARLNVEMSKDLYRKLKRRAVDQDTSVTEIILKLVTEYLSE
jgi:ParG